MEFYLKLGALVALGLLASFLLYMAARKTGRDGDQHRASITRLVQRWLMGALVVGFAATCSFTFLLMTRQAEEDADRVLSRHILDVYGELELSVDDYLLAMTNQLAVYDMGESMRALATIQEREIPDANQNGSVDEWDIMMLLRQYAEIYQLSEINIVDRSGTICHSNIANYLGFDMATQGENNRQARDFYEHMQVAEYYVQDSEPISYNKALRRKYAGVQLPEDCYLSGGGGFLQVGFDEKRLEEQIAYQIQYVAACRHVGESGQIFVFKEGEPREDGARWELVSETEMTLDFNDEQRENNYLEDKGLSFDPATTQAGQRFTGMVDGRWSYCMYQKKEDYYIVVTMPEQEALASRNTSVLMLMFLETQVFVALFILVYLCMKKLVVDNIQRVNDSLNQITEGDLDVAVSVRTNLEFERLSDGINFTVDRLKQLIKEAAARLDKELEFATVIQHMALPSVFPPYPQHKEFSIWASMVTAKEVGGDFYDFYLLGEERLAFLVADVSDKGIPAAMFMMRAKTLIKSLAETGLSVEEIMTSANQQLCERNVAKMFVTVWMGVLELKTGRVTFANAGHNAPLVRHGDGSFEYLKRRPGLVLGGMKTVRYREDALQLAPGDQVFLYTDGVTEATDAEGKFYGEDRLLAAVDRLSRMEPEAICKGVKEDVDAFVGTAPQYDDITMLCLQYHGRESGEI